MRATRPQRGLLVGLLTLIAFGSSAVAITARGAGGTGAAAPSASVVVTGDAGSSGDERGDEGRDGFHGVRFADRDGRGR
jgi:hypothetical protein